MLSLLAVRQRYVWTFVIVIAAITYGELAWAGTISNKLAVSVNIGRVQMCSGISEIPLRLQIKNMTNENQRFFRVYQIGRFFTITDSLGQPVHAKFRETAIEVSGFSTQLAAGETKETLPVMLDVSKLASGNYQIEVAIPIHDENFATLGVLHSQKVEFSLPGQIGQQVLPCGGL